MNNNNTKNSVIYSSVKVFSFTATCNKIKYV